MKYASLADYCLLTYTAVYIVTSSFALLVPWFVWLLWYNVSQYIMHAAFIVIPWLSLFGGMEWTIWTTWMDHWNGSLDYWTFYTHYAITATIGEVVISWCRFTLAMPRLSPTRSQSLKSKSGNEISREGWNFEGVQLSWPWEAIREVWNVQNPTESNTLPLRGFHCIPHLSTPKIHSQMHGHLVNSRLNSLPPTHIFS